MWGCAIDAVTTNGTAPMKHGTRLTTQYILAPWHMRMRWWLALCFWRWSQSFVALHIEDPGQANPLWHR